MPFSGKRLNNIERIKIFLEFFRSELRTPVSMKHESVWQTVVLKAMLTVSMASLVFILSDNLKKTIFLANRMTNIRIDEIAHDLNLNREYLSRCFKREMGLSIQEYLIRTRLNKACELLKKGISIQKVSNLVGYNDQFAFSKIFKKYMGISPSASQNENNNS